MAISLRASTTVSLATRTNTTVSAPAGAVNGSDVIVVAFDAGLASSTPVTITPPSGWATMGLTAYSASDPWAVALAIYVRVHDGASSWTFNHASASSQAFCVAWTGVDTTTPQDCTASTVNGTGAGTANATFNSITTVTAGAQVVGCRGSWDGAAISPPAGWTERSDVAVLWVGDYNASAGATGDISVGHGNTVTTGRPWATIMGALRPAGAASNFSPAIQRRPQNGLIMRGRR